MIYAAGMTYLIVGQLLILLTLARFATDFKRYHVRPAVGFVCCALVLPFWLPIVLLGSTHRR